MAAIQCPKCGHVGNKVIDSRPALGQSAIDRIRVCLACEHNWATIEVPTELWERKDV